MNECMLVVMSEENREGISSKVAKIEERVENICAFQPLQQDQSQS